MMENIRKILKKYRSQIVYLIFGVLTTAVNYVIYIPCFSLLERSGFRYASAASNVIAWIFAVVFAYLTNKPFVFESHDWSARTVISELIKFVSTRVVSLLIETGILLLTVDTLGWNNLVWKLIASVGVVVLNYVGSRLLVFRAKK